MSRPLMTALAAQQGVIDDLRRTQAVQAQQIALIARLAGITPEIQSIRTQADINNPAQPVADPGEQGPTESTEQTVEPTTHDDVRAPGQTGGSTDHVPAAATDVAMTPGATIPTQPYGNLVDVTAPVSGTNTGEISPEQTRIETDVRTLPPGPGGQMNPDVAFPWTISDNQSNSAPPADGEMAGGKHASRFAASMRLARLRIQARLANGDDITLAGVIEKDATLTNDMIEREIVLLGRVAKAAARDTSGVPAGVPRRAASTGTRTAPSLSDNSPGLSTQASASIVDDSMLFLSDGDIAGI